MVGLKEFFTIKMVYFRSYPNIPAFQHSILPWRWYKQVVTKKLVILTGCRNSESLIMGRSQVVRHRILVPAFGGSNPPAPARLRQ